MTVNLSRLRQSGGTGLRQVSAAPFVAAGQNFAQLGKDIQNLGIAGADYLSKQQALQNDNDTNLGLQKFTKDLNESLFDAEFGKVVDFETGQRQLQNPGTIAVDTVKRLQQKQAEIAKTIPSVRQGKFLNATNNQILQAQVKTATIGNTRIKEQAKKLDIEFKNTFKVTAGQLTPEALAKGDLDYQQRLARGVATNAYDADEAAKLLAVFREDVADSVENYKTSQMFAGEPTVEDVQQRSQEIAANPHLNPKEKPGRLDSLWKRAATQSAQRQKSLEKVAEAKSQEERIKLYDILIDPRQNVDGTSGLQQSDLDLAQENGLRHAPTILKMQNIINESEAIENLGLEDNSPAQGYLNELETLNNKALIKNWTAPQLSSHIEILKKKMRDEHAHDTLEKLTSKELVSINKRSSDIIKGFKDDGKRNLEASKVEARRVLGTLFGGSDQFADEFNSKRNELVQDTILAANILIERGEDATVAVEKVRVLAQSVLDEGIQSFAADKFESILDKARRGQLNSDDRFILGAMISRQRKRQGK